MEVTVPPHLTHLHTCITHPNPTHLRISLPLHIYFPPLQAPHQKKKKILLWVCSVSRCITQYISFCSPSLLQVFIVLSHCSGLRPMTSTPSILDPQCDSSWLSCCPVSWRSYGFESQDWLLYLLLQFIDGVDAGVGQLKALSWSTHQLCTHTTRVSFPGLWLAHPVWDLARGRASSPSLMLFWLAHPHPGHQGQLCCAA